MQTIMLFMTIMGGINKVNMENLVFWYTTKERKCPSTGMHLKCIMKATTTIIVIATALVSTVQN